MHTAYLLLGTNLGNRTAYLDQALQLLQQHCGPVMACSSIYETAAWGLTDQPNFLNQVAVIQTALPPETLMQTILQVEAIMGRVRTIKMGPRVIDIDILLIDQLIHHTPLLTVPHPALTQRRFALTPLQQLAATYIHPVENKSISSLLATCTDTLDVHKI